MKPTLEMVSDEFRTAGVPYLLVGGWAVNGHGVTRLTQDADFLITEDRLTDALAALKRCGYQDRGRSELVVRLFPSTPLHLIIDLMLTNSSTFTKMMQASAEVTIEGCPHRIPCVEHLISMKLHALKQGSEGRRSKDVNDIIDLAREHGVDLHSDHFRELCLRFGDQRVLDYIMSLIRPL